MTKDMHYTLFELNNLVRQTIEQTLSEEYWVEAELSEARQVNGHCYMELVEKDDLHNTPVAKASAKCWRGTWSRILPKFMTVTGAQPRAGMKVLMKVYPQFHEAYGFSWIVTDIDPTYTLGDMARRRQEIVRRLKDEGVFDLNKQLPLPLFAQRIAVVSSQTAAGLGDFCHQLTHNGYGFAFTIELFTATMQGEGVEQSVVAALNDIYCRADRFDCVVIIRGGGATSDLSGFDSLMLAENIANFPLPVITGIGHDRDETVADMVAHTRVKTPTAAAALLIDNLKAVADRIDTAARRIHDNTRLLMQRETQRLDRITHLIPTYLSLVTTRQTSRLDTLSSRLATAATTAVERQSVRLQMAEGRIRPAVDRRMTAERHRMEMMSQRLAALDPQLLLSRGYSITTLNGKAVTDSCLLSPGDVVETRLAKGRVEAKTVAVYKG